MKEAEYGQPSSPLQQAGVAPQLSGYRFVILGLTMLLNFSFGINFFAVAPITPLIIDDYGVNRTTASLLTGLVLLVQAGFTIPAGMLVGRVGLKKLIGVGWLLAAAPALSFLASDFFTLLALRVLYAVSFAITIPALGPLLMQWFRPRELPLVNGIGLAVATLGIAISTFSAAPLAEAIGWKAALSAFGAVSLVGVVCWIGLGKVHGPVHAGGRLSIKGAWKVLRSRTTLLLAMADAGPFAQYVALTAWLPTFYFEVHGMSLNEAGVALGLLPLTGFFTVLLAGVLPLRVNRRRPFLIVPGFLVGIAGLGTFLLGGTVGIYPALVLLGITSWFYLPILMTIPMELPDAIPEQVSMVLATIITIGGVLSFLAPLVVGSLTDAFGTYIPGFCIFAVLAGSLAVAGYLLPETRRPRT